MRVTIDRPKTPVAAAEKLTLVAFLDHQRATLRMKCDGVAPADLVRPTSPPSTLRLLGLVRHMVEVESWWFCQVFLGEAEHDIYATQADRDADFHIDEADEASVAETWARYDEEVAKARAVVERSDLDSLSVRLSRQGEPYALRWIMVHMIEEYARHNGHADLIREAIDGSTGV
jgi:hypothetical protein